MTLATLHARFLQHCAVEKRLRPMTIASYRSDFGLFLDLLRRGEMMADRLLPLPTVQIALDAYGYPRECPSPLVTTPNAGLRT